MRQSVSIKPVNSTTNKKKFCSKLKLTIQTKTVKKVLIGPSVLVHLRRDGNIGVTRRGNSWNCFGISVEDALLEDNERRYCRPT